jgi:dipeptidyl aminopeptidase/acylaminoacyl peptidase
VRLDRPSRTILVDVCKHDALVEVTAMRDRSDRSPYSTRPDDENPHPARRYVSRVPPVGGMRPEDVYELTGVSDPRLRPGGNDVAYVVWSIDKDENAYRQSIWIAKTDGSEPPRGFTTGKNDSQPRWSPDGNRLAFVSKRGDEKARNQLYVMPAGGGEPQCLTDVKEDVGEPAWSPDGTQIAFSARVQDDAYEEEDDKKRAPRRFKRLQFKLDSVGWTGDRRRHIFVVPADGSGEAKQLTDGDFEDAQPTWTPDGEIAFTSSRDDDWDIELKADIFVVPAAGGEPRRLTPGDGSHSAPSYSPDGSLLAVKWSPAGYDFPRHAQIGVIDAKSGGDRLLTTSLDRTCDPYPDLREPIWDGTRSSSGSRIAWRPRTVCRRGGERFGTVARSCPRLRRPRRAIARTGSTAPNPSELFVDEKQLTDLGLHSQRVAVRHA